MRCQSAALRQVARTATSTSAGPGSGRGTSATSSVSGPPYRCCTTAVIVGWFMF